MRKTDSPPMQRVIIEDAIRYIGDPRCTDPETNKSNARDMALLLYCVNSNDNPALTLELLEEFCEALIHNDVDYSVSLIGAADAAIRDNRFIGLGYDKATRIAWYLIDRFPEYEIDTLRALMDAIITSRGKTYAK